MKWIAGESNPSDALTKRNPNTWRMLNLLLASGLVSATTESRYTLDSAVWQ